MTDETRDRNLRPGRMQDGSGGEFLDSQPNRRDEREPAGARGGTPPARIDHDDPVEEASDESFPASDPPSFTPGGS